MIPAQPRDDAAERAVIGSMILSAQARDDVMQILQPEHFYDPLLEETATAIGALHLAGKPVDVITVADELRRRGSLDRVGGLGALHDLTQGVSTPGSADYYAQIVYEKAALRSLEAVAHRIMATAQHEGVSADEAITQAQADIAALGGAREQEGDAVGSALQSLERKDFVPTPWSELNALVAGWHPGRLHVIGARPAIGKSTVGVNIALDAASKGVGVVFFSLEMSRDEVVLSALSNMGSVDGGRILHRKLTDGDKSALDLAGKRFRALPITVHDKAGITLAKMRSQIRSAQKRHGGPVIVVIDYLTLIRPPSKSDDRRLQVDEIVQGAKEMAKELYIPVVALAQLNRQAEDDGRAEKMPTLKDLRESGGIEAAADFVALLHRARSEAQGSTTQLMWLVAKNRFGPSAGFSTYFQGGLSRVTDWPENPHQKGHYEKGYFKKDKEEATA